MDINVTETFKRTAEVYYPGKYRQIVSMGGSRSSKTYSILQILMLVMLSRHRIKITVWRDTKVVCRATVMEDFKKIILFDYNTYKKFKENKQLGKFVYKPTNSEIIFEGADSVGKVLGGAQDISYFNEVTEFAKPVYLQITQRTAETIFCDYNPSKDFWLEDYRHDPNTTFIHSTFEHNAYCPKNIVEQLMSYEPWERRSYKIIDSTPIYKGAPITRENQPPPNELNVKRGTADEYMWLVYGLGIGAEKPNRIYRGWKKISLEHFDSIAETSYFGIDFGTFNPTAILEIKYDGDGAFYVCPRFYRPLTSVDISMSSVFANEVPMMKLGYDLVVCDSAKRTYIDILRDIGYLAEGAPKGNDSIQPGITLVQGFTIYFVEDHELSSSFNKEYVNYSWEVDRYGKSTDKPVKKDDHYMDVLRYVITYLVKYLGIQV
jgi:PBSX family phage terminase large subunit